MRHAIATIIAFAAVFVPVQCAGQGALYTASSKAQGAVFDITVTETKREEFKSYLSVPGFHSRTAPAARWLMCAYTDLAIRRGFAFWSVVYPAEGSELVVVALSKAADASPKDLLGPDYAADRVLGPGMVPVEKFVAFCGMRRQ